MALDDIREAARLVYRSMPPTPQYRGPLLGERLGAEVWVKHENHTPIGAFKVRGGLTYIDRLKRLNPSCPGVVSATRGNHGQSIGYAARQSGLAATIVVPFGNSVEKNAAMRALGVNLVEHGADFQESREYAMRLGEEKGLPALEVVYLPIGMGSGGCSMIAARDALGHRAEIIGVVSE
jgi:threonine dehydratase